MKAKCPCKYSEYKYIKYGSDIFARHHLPNITFARHYYKQEVIDSTLYYVRLVKTLIEKVQNRKGEIKLDVAGHTWCVDFSINV